MAKPLHVAVIGYDGVQALDIAGPMDVFAAANALHTHPKQIYQMSVLSPKGRQFRAENGLVFRADAALDEASAADTIIVPGGAGMRETSIVQPIAEWLRLRAPRTRRVASICTGLYALAQAGLLNGRRATTHWRFAADLARKFRDISIEPDAIYMEDDKIYSSAGVTAGIDLTLSFVESDIGENAALSVARELVVYMKRQGGQTQFSEPLQFQTKAADRFADLAGWILRNMHKNLSIELLAKRANLSPRQFNRRFKTAFGVPPAKFIENLRLNEARRRLSSSRRTVDSIAASVGYTSTEVFRHAFQRQFGVAPSTYRKCFGA